MDCRKLALTIAGAALALYGCGPGDGGGTVFPERDMVCEQGATAPCETSANAHTDAERTHADNNTGDGDTHTFAVNLLSLPQAASGQAAGFNLDNLDSGEGSTATDANCEEYQQDYQSLTDADHVGVDNSLQSILSTIEGFINSGACADDPHPLDCTIQEQIASGSLILMIEVTGVDDFEYDSDVSIQLFRGQVPGGGMPTVGDDGLLAAGQTFEVMGDPLGAPVQGDIFDGRLRASTPLLTLSITAMGFTLPLMITNPEVRFDISEDGLENGAIGGVLGVDAIVDAAAMIMPGLEDTVRPVVEGIADVGPSADDPMTCESLSVGITFGATTAVRQ